VSALAAPSIASPRAWWPAVLRRWSWVLVLLVSTVLYELVRVTLLTTGNPLYLPTLILLGAVAVPAAFVAFVYGRRLAFGVSGWVVLVTALVGGVVGVLVAGLLEYETLRSSGGLPFIVIGLLEELAKLLIPALVLLLTLRRMQSADGLLLGVASGAGFAVLETMGYALVVLVESRGNLAVVNEILVDRGVFSPAAHMAWTGLAAAALWRAAAAHWRPRAVVEFGLVYLFVALLHVGWDAAGSVWGHAVLAVVSLGLLVWTAHRLSVVQRRAALGVPSPPAPAPPAAFAAGPGR